MSEHEGNRIEELENDLRIANDATLVLTQRCATLVTEVERLRVDLDYYKPIAQELLERLPEIGKRLIEAERLGPWPPTIANRWSVVIAERDRLRAEVERLRDDLSAAHELGALLLARAGEAERHAGTMDAQAKDSSPSARAVGRMGLSGNLHVDERPTDEAVAEQAAMTEAYYADPDV